MTNSESGPGQSRQLPGQPHGTPDHQVLRRSRGIGQVEAQVADEAGSNVNKAVYLTISGGYICGDSNADGKVNVADAVKIISYVFAGGDPPDPLESADTNCDSRVNVADAVKIISYVFAGGSIPCDTDGDDIPDC